MRKVALIGAGRGGHAILPILFAYKNIQVVGVVDTDPLAPGLLFAKKNHIPIFSDYKIFLKGNLPNVILNLTHDPKISEDIEKKYENIEVLGAVSAKLLWDIVYERKKKDDENIRLLKELSQTNQKFKDTTKYLENILENSGDIVIATDLSARIVKCNKGAEDILGYNKEELIGNSVELFYVNKDERRKILKFVKSKGIISNYETKYFTKMGVVLDVNLTLSLLKDDTDNIIGTVGISKDITEKKKLEKEILRSNKELENFVYTVSHDLQAPLRAIDGFSNLLLEEYKEKLKGDGLRYIDRLIKGAGRMKMLIEDLLSLSKIGKTGKPFKDVSISELIEEIQDFLQYNLEKKKAKLIIGELPVVYCDNARIRQVFTNLIINALKYVKKGIAPEIVIGYKDKIKKNEFEFFVKDNGIGIKKNFFNKIFNLFQRLHNMDEYEGTGVGLTIVKRIIEIHGGKIWLESKENNGTTFYFTLPKNN